MNLTPAQAFGLALRETRKKRGLSQEETALAVGIDRSYYGRIERADKVPTLTTVWRVAETLDTKPSNLIVEAERLISSGTR